MFLRKLFASIRANRRSTQQYNDARGALISRRMQELLDVTKPPQGDMPAKPLLLKNHDNAD